MKFNNKVKFAGITLLTGLIFGCLGSVATSRMSVETQAYTPGTTYTNGDSATYYNGISSTASGSTLLSALQSLNSSKRKKTVGYSSMGTTPSGAFSYTDYDPSSTSTDSNGQKYGSKILSFYSGTSTTSWNREHVWPNSHGGGSGGSVSSPYVDADIHMPRPTITAENSNRGNSFYVEGMSHSSNGWDPVTAFGESGCYQGKGIRGECARIIFYCMVAHSSLKLADSATVSSDSGCTMGKLSDMLKWNLEYSVNSRELNRNEGAEYLQGNRNPFIDHPEYACKIWGDTNSTTKSICANASTTTKTLSKITITSTDSSNYYVSQGYYITLKATATYSDSTTADITDSVTWTTSNSSYATVDQTGKVTGVAGSASGQSVTITASYGSVSGTHTVSVFTSGEYGTAVSGSGSGDSGSTSETSAGSITASDLATSYETTDTLHTASSGIKFYTNQCGHFSNSGKMQFKRNAGYLYNAEAINLDKVTINTPSGADLVVYGGTSSSSITTTITGSNNVYDLSGYTYFKIKAGSGGVSYCESIDVTAKSSGSTTTDSLSLNKSTLSVTAGSTGSITATASGNVTWKSSNTSVATVSASGTNNVNATITGVAAGSATITATCGTKTATCTVTVTSSTVSVTGVTLSPTTLSLVAGNTGTLTATVAPTNATNKNVTWKSSNTSVATVSNGTVTAVAAGSATITVTTSDGSKTATCAVTVTAATVAVTGVSLSSSTLSLSVGGTSTLTATVSPTNATNKNVTWSSSNTSVATVSNGTVTAVAAGSATITVTTADGSKTATCTVTVTASSGSDTNTWPYDTNYAYVMSYTNASSTYYFTGDTTTKYTWYGATSTTKDDSALMYFETNSNDGNYNLYCYRNEVKTYIQVVISGTHINFNMTETEPSTGWTYSSTYSSITFAIDGTSYLIGSSGTYETVSCNTTSLLTYPAAFELVSTAENYAELFLDRITCSGSGSVTFASADWTEMSEEYDSLLSSVKTTLKNATANAGGSTVEQCAARYDAVVAKYSDYTDFMSRGTAKATKPLNAIQDDTTLTTIVAVALIASITAIGFVVVTKKKSVEE